MDINASINKKTITETFGKLRNFFKETRAEMKKVVWPSRQYVTSATVIILIIVILVGIYVMLTDFALARVFDYLLHAFK